MRKRSWPAVSHWNTLSAHVILDLGGRGRGCSGYPYDLKLHGLALKFDSPDFLKTRLVSTSSTSHYIAFSREC